MIDLMEVSKEIENWLLGFIAAFPAGKTPFSSNSDLVTISDDTGLAPSILALKAVIQTGVWSTIPSHEQDAWIDRILSFQCKAQKISEANFFIDEKIEEVIDRGPFLSRLFNKKWNLPVWLWRMSLLRQCISTCKRLNIAEKIKMPLFFRDENQIAKWLKGILDLEDIWTGYSHLSGLFTIIKHFEECGHSSAVSSSEILKKIDLEYAVISLKNKSSKMAVSGAMKLTTLADIAKTTLPHPEILIDKALSLTEAEHVCYFLNPIIVLDRASKYSTYRKSEIMGFYQSRINMLNNFLMPDKGFSTLTSGSLINYAQIKATSNGKEGDIHAVHILAWAIKILADNTGSQLNWLEPPT
ncbi:MAG: hypothetical protein ACYTFY_00755 [Planctomycetota bacterium]|jgi:hypothetical protein